MLKFKKKDLVSRLLFILLLLFICVLSPFWKGPALIVLKYPLNLLNLIRREIKGIVFYHRNYAQNERLKREIDFLKKKLAETSEVYLENRRLKTLLSFKQKSSHKLVAASVIARDPSNWSSLIVIDKGTSSGIKKGFAAITHLGLAGRVVEVSSSTAKVMLLNDPNLAISCLVQRSRQEGLVVGSLGGTLIMKYLPKECDIEVSDIIVTSGLTTNYPKGLLIGRVVAVEEEFSGLMRYALIKPVVNLAQLEEVLIIID